MAALAATIVVGHAAGAAAQSPVDFTVTGTSTVRGWTCAAQGTMVLTSGSASSAPVPGIDSGIPTATVTVPLKAFKCPNDEMTEHLNQAMKSDKFTEIVFKLEKYEVAAGKGQASGTMTIVGNSQPITVPVTLRPAAGGVEIEGDTRLDMTKYGVDPPVVMMGLMKVGPQIRIQFKGKVAR
jgi:polyisoprenoid-binding protein YceI